MTPTPTPSEPHFPADPIAVLKFGWPCLVAYYLVAAIIVLLLWRSLRASRFTHSVKHRVITATILAVIFAPGEVSDFFLFNLPGPAIVGLLALILGIVLIVFSQPAVLLKASFWGGFVTVIGGYYVLPIFVVFLIAYALLSLYSRSARPSTANA